jgi:hypothetical protein
MSLFVFITESCKENASQYALSDEILRFKDKVEKAQTTSLFDPVPPPYLVKKKFGSRQGRLIADLRPVGDHAVVVFLAVMIRGDHEYETEFIRDPVAYGKQHFRHLVAQGEIESYLHERTRVEPPPTKPVPSGEEFAFLYNAFAHHRSSLEDDMVYETHEWKEAVSEERIAIQLVKFPSPCLEALKLPAGLHRVDIPGKQGWGMWVFRSDGRLLLITPITDTTADAAEQIANRYRENLTIENNVTHIIRASRRAYPAYMLVDEETWVEIEKEPVANMALSPEESEVLMSARRPEGAFPIFVNGRAGSGKSTILQYLFADLLYYYLAKPETHVIAPPVYLTANGELLRVARSFVERVLKSEAAFRQNGSGNLVTENGELLSEAFQEFRPFLLSLVPQEVRRDGFAPNNFVDYSRFRLLWNQWFSQDPEASREFGPDVCWHIIRSYIKGMLSEDLMDPDEYRQLPKNQITVAQTTFERVFYRVWQGRYSELREQRGLWDDQDLARYILEKDLAKPLYPAVLCDEAQDFTRIELELLLRLNLFSNRSVPAHDLCRVPFVFAGDQFQTLNPTGFRWDAIKVAFIEKFIHALDPAGRSGRTELNYHELRFNYRSTPSIVRFINGVQALRAAVLKMPELRPQTPWVDSIGVFPVTWFESSDSRFWSKFKDAESFVLVVPCNEGEEATYVKADPILSEHVRFEDGIPLNVLSAARSKGREYPGVVVYGFGSAAPENLQDLLANLREERDEERHQLLPVEYFISRLYVAVSRPKQRLIIVDSAEAMNGLWDFLRREEKTSEIVSVADRGRSLWTADPEVPLQPAVEGMSMGNAEDLTKDSAGDPIENAQAFEEDGRARRDSFLLRQAAQSYRAAGKAQKAMECRARALELDGNFVHAAKSFCDSGYELPDGVRCYWKAGEPGWKELIELGKRNAHVARETEFKLARVCRDKKASTNECINVLQEIANRMREPAFTAEVASHEAWQRGVHKTIEIALNDTPRANAARLAEVLEQIESVGVRINSRTMAEVYHAAGSHVKAVKRWQEAGETSSDPYLRAKAAVSPYPEKLEALSKVGAFEDLLSEFESNRGVPLSREQWLLVGGAFLMGARFTEAFDAAWEAQDPTLFRRFTVKTAEAGLSEMAIRGMQACITSMTSSGEWDALVKFASSLEFGQDKDGDNPIVREIVDSQAEALQCSLVSALARSDQFAGLPGHLQKQFTDFFRRFLRVKEGRWRSAVSVDEAGAAIERGGRFTDALAFYEAVQKEPNFSEGEKEFSRVRWLVSKNRQLDHERQLGPKNRRVIELERELNEALRRSKIPRVSDLPRFPLLEPAPKPIVMVPECTSAGDTTLGETSVAPYSPNDSVVVKAPSTEINSNKGEKQDNDLPSLPDRVYATIGDLRIELSRHLGRCNFSHSRTFKTAHINLRDGTAGGEIHWREEKDSHWSCEEWGIVLRCSEDTLEIESMELGLTFVLSCPSSER